jgi:hypothetical protein
MRIASRRTCEERITCLSSVTAQSPLFSARRVLAASNLRDRIAEALDLQPLRRFSFRSGRQVSSMPWRVRDRRCGYQTCGGRTAIFAFAIGRLGGLVILAPCDAVLGCRRRRLLNSSRGEARNARNEQPFRQYRPDAHGDDHGRPDSALLDWVPIEVRRREKSAPSPPLFGVRSTH